MKRSMFYISEVANLINEGRILIIAGHEDVLSLLPDGKWIGGTIPYFMGDEGGLFSKELIHVVDVTEQVTNVKFLEYQLEELDEITKNSFNNGFNFVVLPALQKVHFEFAMKAPFFKDLFQNPLVGWVAGVEFENVGSLLPKVFIGNKGFSDRVVVMHSELPYNKVARLEIVNVYKQGNGDEIIFPKSGFDADTCIINGNEKNFSEYLKDKNVSDQLPLVADYAGAMLNVGFRNYIEENRVEFYAPVFEKTVYKIADRIDDYSNTFHEKFKHDLNTTFACNCLMNYFNFNLEGRKINEITGPITYGEIGYQLLNQTLVYLLIEDR